MDPVFGTLPGSSTLQFRDTADAKRVEQENRESRVPHMCQPPKKVHDDAVAAVRNLGGDIKDERQVLGQYTVQFGKYVMQTFKWLTENSLGYAAWLAENLERETLVNTPLSHNKFKYKEYLASFPEGRQAVELKKMQRLAKKTPLVSSLMVSRQLTPRGLQLGVKRLLSTAKFKPNIPKAQATPSTVPHPVAGELSDVDLISETEKFAVGVEKVFVAEGSRSSLTLSQTKDYPLPEGWRQSLPKSDLQWVSKALFKYSPSGSVELDTSKANKLWYRPPQPLAVCNQAPHADIYFSHRLLLWMPRRLWNVVLRCPRQRCDQQELTLAGIYPHVRQVLDIDEFYLLAADKLRCPNCESRYISWNRALINQLDMGHRVQFPCLLTYRYACDARVVVLMRQRGLGNSATQLEKKLGEQHGEAWMHRTIHYLTDAKGFSDARKSGLLVCPDFEQPPSPISIPKWRWLLAVYAVDVMQRIDEVKAAITSTFGTVLKLDSTKKIVKKLAGQGAGTATWMTNVGNENGEVLMSVLTSGEGYGLAPMVSGIINRYKAAQVSPPNLLYVDRDCCANNHLQRLFGAWPNLVIRLDVWHFMRRLAVGCTTESHQLYGYFMGRLSKCIFEWSSDDLQKLKAAKRSELELQYLDPSEEQVIQRLAKKEFSLHCRRRTRGADQTTTMIRQLLVAFSGDQGLDTLGVPLFDKDRIWDIWETQRRHVSCLQDPEDVSLYTQTGTLLKGGVLLPTFRCSRGSTSLESFHLHLNRFIPGTSASDMHYQTYLLEGLVRWNEDRARSASGLGSAQAKTYSGILRHTCNSLSRSVFGKRLVPDFVGPREYTGELIGVEFLYSQTGAVLQDFTADPESEQASQVEPDDDDQHADDDELEDVQDVDDPTVSTLVDSRPTVLPSSAPASKLIPAPPPQPLPSTSSASLDPEESVDPHDIEGFRRVEELAVHLVSLRDQPTALTHNQASRVIRLWNNLSMYDKQPSKLSARHRTKLTQGRFKVSKGTRVIPGVDSTRRCFLGQNAGPAQWPDCNRYMEQTVVALCSLFPSHIREGGRLILRWTLISRAYKKIRESVVGNARIMAETSLQLLEINNATLIQWYNKRSKEQELKVLAQGIHLPAPAISASSSLPAARAIPVTPHQVPPEGKFIFVLPPNTAGQATRRQKKLKSKPPPSSTASSSTPDLPSAPALTSPPAADTLMQTAPQSVPRSTLWYRRLQEKKQQAGELVIRRKRTFAGMICKKCGKERESTTHKQYYGSWWCAETSDVDFETWRATLQQTKTIKKKKSE